MKIGIVTLVSENYGNKYQNYAVETILKQYGSVETFAVADEYIPHMERRAMCLIKKISLKYIAKVLQSRMMYQYDITNTSRNVFINLIYVLCNKKKLTLVKEERKRKFSAYEEQYLHLSGMVIDSNICDNKEWIDSFDFFICGSDQIWNPTYSTTSSLAFLSFAKRGQAVAFAPSFGVDSIPEERREDFAKWINRIDYLSVREDAGQKIIKELTRKHAEVLLDPTMAIDVEEWTKMARKPVCSLPEKYILCYFLGCLDKKTKKRIKDYSKKMRLPVVSLFNIEEPEFYVLDPNEVLYAIQKAEIVLTDSFHGSVFSILFHKNFAVFERNEGGASMESRLSTLLAKFGLEKRKNMQSGCFNSIEDNEWEKVEEILFVEKKKTRLYVKEALGVK